MPNIRNFFDSYCVTISTPSVNNDRPIASIWCYEDVVNVGWVEFFPNSANIPQPSYENGIVKLYYPIDRFSSIMDLLRNDKPLELYFNPDGSWGCVSTRMPYLESVGKNERPSFWSFLQRIPFFPKSTRRTS